MRVTRCKFRCDYIGQKPGWGDNPIVHEAALNPVMGGSEENKAFWAASPSGAFTISCSKFQPFELGKEYYLDISEAVAPVPAEAEAAS